MENSKALEQRIEASEILASELQSPEAGDVDFEIRDEENGVAHLYAKKKVLAGTCPYFRASKMTIRYSCLLLQDLLPSGIIVSNFLPTLVAREKLSTIWRHSLRIRKVTRYRSVQKRTSPQLRFRRRRSPANPQYPFNWKWLNSHDDAQSFLWKTSILSLCTIFSITYIPDASICIS